MRPITVNKTVSRALVATGFAAALIGGGAGIASAHDIATSSSLYNGSEAGSAHNGCSVSHGNARVTDTRADGYEVYADYYRQGGPQERIVNDHGFLSTAHTGCASPSVVRIRGCTSRPVIFDVCSDFKS